MMQAAWLHQGGLAIGRISGAKQNLLGWHGDVRRETVDGAQVPLDASSLRKILKPVGEVRS